MSASLIARMEEDQSSEYLANLTSEEEEEEEEGEEEEEEERTRTIWRGEVEEKSIVSKSLAIGGGRGREGPGQDGS